MIPNDQSKLLNVELIESMLKERKITGKIFMESIYKVGCNKTLNDLRVHGINFVTACKISDFLGIPLDSLRLDKPQSAGNYLQGNNNSNNNNYTYINDNAAELNALRLEVKSLNAIIKEKETKEALYERLLSQLSASKDETVSLYERESNKIQ